MGPSGCNRVQSWAEWELIPESSWSIRQVGKEIDIPHTFPCSTSNLYLNWIDLDGCMNPYGTSKMLQVVLQLPRGLSLIPDSTVTEQHETDRTWGTITQDESFERNQIGLGCTGIYIILYLGSALGGFRTASLPLDWWAFTHDPIG